MNVSLILLAAGNSRRFDGNKLLHEFQGKPMYRYIVDEVAKLPPDFFCRKIVVTQYGDIAATLESMGYEVVENHESELGISHSIHLALDALASDSSSEAYCFAVCDQPHLKAGTILNLVNGWRKSGKGIGCLGSQGDLGNPAVFSHRYVSELLALEGDVGGKRVIRKHSGDLYLHEVEDGQELVDIDVR